MKRKLHVMESLEALKTKQETLVRRIQTNQLNANDVVLGLKVLVEETDRIYQLISIETDNSV